MSMGDPCPTPTSHGSKRRCPGPTLPVPSPAAAPTAGPRSGTALDAAARMLVCTAVAVDLVGARKPPPPPTPAQWILDLELPKGGRPQADDSSSEEDDSDGSEGQHGDCWAHLVAVAPPAGLRSLLLRAHSADQRFASRDEHIVRPRNRGAHAAQHHEAPEREAAVSRGRRPVQVPASGADSGPLATMRERSPRQHATGSSAGSTPSRLRDRGPGAPSGGAPAASALPRRARSGSRVSVGALDNAGIADLQLLVEDMTGTAYVLGCAARGNLLVNTSSRRRCVRLVCCRYEDAIQRLATPPPHEGATGLYGDDDDKDTVDDAALWEELFAADAAAEAAPIKGTMAAGARVACVSMCSPVYACAHWCLCRTSMCVCVCHSDSWYVRSALLALLPLQHTTPQPTHQAQLPSCTERRHCQILHPLDHL